MKTTFADPVRMMELGAPRLIRTDEELERYTEALFQLTALEEPTVAEMEAINLLSSPVEVLKFLMEHNGLQQRDLMPELGSESNVSLILSGKRNLTVPHVQRLSRRFGVPASVFLESVATAA